MEGLEISEVYLSSLEFSSRIDAEYYKPSLLSYEKHITQKGGTALKNLSSFLIGPFGSSFTVDNYVDIPDYRYIRGKDVKPMILKDDDNVYMPQEDYERLSRYALKENDILVSVVGTLGNAALITKKDLPAIFSCKSTVLRTKQINAGYLIAYLNCKYGRQLLLRKERGAIQKGFNLGDLESLEIFTPSSGFQDQINTLFQTSLKQTEKSKEVYNKAETLLLATLNLKEFQLSQEPVNVKNFSESFASSGRLDAEYYQVKYEQVVNRIISTDYDQLVNIVKIKKSIEPGSSVYADEGLPFVRVSDYNKFGLSTPDKYLTDDFCKENAAQIKKLKPKKETILFSKDGSVGTAYMLREDADFITSGAILHLTVKDKTKIIPEYLTLALNSKLVQMQAERDAGGSIILHWRVSEIEKVVVPIIDFDKQREIADLVEESFQLKKQSEHLLEVAKTAVEMAIEKDEKTAMEYIENEIEMKNNE